MLRYIHTYIHTCMRGCVRVCVRACVRACVRTYVSTNVHTCARTSSFVINVAMLCRRYDRSIVVLNKMCNVCSLAVAVLDSYDHVKNIVLTLMKTGSRYVMTG